MKRLFEFFIVSVLLLQVSEIVSASERSERAKLYSKNCKEVLERARGSIDELNNEIVFEGMLRERKEDTSKSLTAAQKRVLVALSESLSPSDLNTLKIELGLFQMPKRTKSIARLKETYENTGPSKKTKRWVIGGVILAAL